MTITKRNTKGSALTYNEMDENIRDLYEDTTLDRVVGNGATTTAPVNLTRINFPAHPNDYTYIESTVNGTSTSLDFVVGDDDGDSFKWRFNHYADGVGTPINYMTLRADQTNANRNTGVLDVTGAITADYMAANHTSVVETGSGASPFTDIESLYGKRVIWNRSTTQTFRFPLPSASDVGKSVIFINAQDSGSGSLFFDVNTNAVGASVADTAGLKVVTNNFSLTPGGICEFVVTAQGKMIVFGSNLLNY